MCVSLSLPLSLSLPPPHQRLLPLPPSSNHAPLLKPLHGRTFNPTGTNECSDMTPCVAGQYIADAGSSIEDRFGDGGGERTHIMRCLCVCVYVSVRMCLCLCVCVCVCARVVARQRLNRSLLHILCALHVCDCCRTCENCPAFTFTDEVRLPPPLAPLPCVCVSVGDTLVVRVLLLTLTSPMRVSEPRPLFNLRLPPPPPFAVLAARQTSSAAQGLRRAPTDRLRQRVS